MQSSTIALIAYGAVITVILAAIFGKPLVQNLQYDGSYQAPDDSTESAWRFLTYVVLLSCSAIFALIAQVPSRLFGFELVIITFALVVLWETRVDLVSGKSVPLLGREGYYMNHPWSREHEPFQYWRSIVFNLAFGSILLFIGVRVVVDLLREFFAS